MMNHKVLVLTLPLLLSLFLPCPAGADGALIFKLGSFFPEGGSDLWQSNVDTFDFNVSDFNYVMGGVELDLGLNSYLDVAVGFDGYSRSVGSRYVDFVREDGTDIVQSFKLKVLPITGGIRFLPIRKFHRFIPHVTAGAGLYYFNYEEAGEFVNLMSMEIIPGTFGESGITPGAYAGAALEYMFSSGIDPGQGWFVFAEFRRHWASAELGGDFEKEEIDLGGSQLAFGVSLRF
jgi:hypothetical protein